MIKVTATILVPTNGSYARIISQVDIDSDDLDFGLSQAKNLYEQFAKASTPENDDEEDQVLYELNHISDGWAEHELPVKPCIRCMDETIEYRERSEMCSYCYHITGRDD